MNQRHLRRMLGVAAVYLAAALPASALQLRCPPDSVKVGDACIDKYESSIWQIPSENAALVKRVQVGANPARVGRASASVAAARASALRLPRRPSGAALP